MKVCILSLFVLLGAIYATEAWRGGFRGGWGGWGWGGLGWRRWGGWGPWGFGGFGGVVPVPVGVPAPIVAPGVGAFGKRDIDELDVTTTTIVPPTLTEREGRALPPKPGRALPPKPGRSLPPKPGRAVPPKPGRDIDELDVTTTTIVPPTLTEGSGRVLPPKPGRSLPPKPGRDIDEVDMTTTTIVPPTLTEGSGRVLPPKPGRAVPPKPGRSSEEEEVVGAEFNLNDTVLAPNKTFCHYSSKHTKFTCRGQFEFNCSAMPDYESLGTFSFKLSDLTIVPDLTMPSENDEPESFTILSRKPDEKMLNSYTVVDPITSKNIVFRLFHDEKLKDITGFRFEDLTCWQKIGEMIKDTNPEDIRLSISVSN